MSHQRSRSPLQSRPSTHGRRDAYYGEQYHAHSGPWRSSENVDNRNAESGICWDNGSSQAEEQVDHWAKFIDAIGRAEKRKAASMSRCHAPAGIQDFCQDSARSPRQMPRERLSSPEALQYSMETHQRIQSPGQRRSGRDDAHVDRRYSRSSSPRHLKGRRHDRMEHGYQNEEHKDRREGSSYSERSLKSNYMEPRLHFKQSEDLDPQEEYTESHRGFSPHRAPVVVEHSHGIPKHDARSLNPGRERERPTSRDSARERGDPRNHGPSRGRERPRSREPVRDQEHPRFGEPVRARERLRSHDPVAQRGHPRSHDPVAQRGHPRSHDPVAQRAHPRSHDPVAQQGHPRSHDPGRDREFPRGSGQFKHQEHPRSRDILRTSDLPRDRDYPKSSELQRGSDPTRRRGSSRSNELRQRERDYNHQPGTSRDGHSGSLNYHIREDSGFHTSSAESWREEMHPRGNRDCVLGQGNVLKESPQNRNANHPGARMDFASHETLKIKVDMSRPVGQSSHLGYSSERQLSLDLVNVGRQRLDFLPMLEHSGMFTETAMHSGTFAQEIITLVHHVKENYFQGQDMTLNERFSNEQEYSLTDEFAEDEQEMEDLGPIINRPLGSTSSDMQIFCKIGPLQSQRKPHVPAPGDLRHDLERKRQEKLEGVKITIAGQNLSRMLPQSLEIESVYVGDKEPREPSWSNDEPCEPSWSNDEPREPSWSNDEPREPSWSNDDPREPSWSNDEPREPSLSNDEPREASWSNDEPRQPAHWKDEPRPKRPAPNCNSRWHLKRGRHRQGARMKRNPNNGARW